MAFSSRAVRLLLLEALDLRRFLDVALDDTDIFCDAADDIVTAEADELAIPCDSVKDGVIIVLVFPLISSDLVVEGILADSAIEVTSSLG